MKNLLFFERRASALLLSFFLMSVLILVALAVSVLVIHDLRASRTMVSGTQALYAAEGMTELGLQTLKDNLPGYEPAGFTYNLVSNAVASLNVRARGDSLSCEGQVGRNSEGFRALARNESIQIPLFAQINAEGSVEEISSFHVEFYVATEEGEVTLSPMNDVLRWKILGLKEGTDTTQALSEYIPLYASGMERVSVFGTDPDIVDASVPTSYTYGKFFEGGTSFKVYPIATFLEDHSYNHLILTNVVQRDSENTIFFRFNTSVESGVCEYVQLTSTGNGATGDTQRELSTMVKEGENLPVFDFVLYHTGDF